MSLAGRLRQAASAASVYGSLSGVVHRRARQLRGLYGGAQYKHFAVTLLALACGCSEADVAWLGFWGFLGVLLVYGAIELWHRK